MWRRKPGAGRMAAAKAAAPDCRPIRPRSRPRWRCSGRRSAPLVVTGRGARGAGAALAPAARRDRRALSRHRRRAAASCRPSIHRRVGAMRAAAMNEADLVLVVGRKLDYQLGYGSPAVFPHAQFIRLADSAGELLDNRRGEPELLATPALALAAIVAAAGNRERALDQAWAEVLRARHATSAPRDHAGPGNGRATARCIPRAIFDAIRRARRARLHRHRRRRRSPELRARRACG